MRTVYLGTSEFAADVLRRLADSAHRPALVVSRPDRPRGRGRKLKAPPVVELARELGLEVDQPDSVNTDPALARIADAEPQRLVVCAFGALIKEPLLSAHGPILNVHPSLLPRWRGAAPIERAILAGDEETGVSIMQLTAGLDSGPVCLQDRQPIEPEDDYGTLSGRLAQQGADLLIRVLDDEQAGAPADRCRPQDDTLATYAEKLTPADRRLDPTQPAAALALRVRALSPHIGAYAELPAGERLGVWRAAVAGPSGLSPDEHCGTPTLACADGLLELLVVQPPGKQRMAGADYVRGLRR